MRFMMLVHVPADTSADHLPDLADAARLQRYDDDLTRAGVLLAGDGLLPPADGVRVEFAGGRSRVVEGASAGRRELVLGYWLLQVSSAEEAVEWARRCPMRDGDVIEVRRVREAPATWVSPPARGPGR
jgi:hypothetical protein